jgi:hypothetical protein
VTGDAANQDKVYIPAQTVTGDAAKQTRSIAHDYDLKNGNGVGKAQSPDVLKSHVASEEIVETTNPVKIDSKTVAPSALPAADTADSAAVDESKRQNLIRNIMNKYYAMKSQQTILGFRYKNVIVDTFPILSILRTYLSICSALRSPKIRIQSPVQITSHSPI